MLFTGVGLLLFIVAGAIYVKSQRADASATPIEIVEKDPTPVKATPAIPTAPATPPDGTATPTTPTTPTAPVIDPPSDSTKVPGTPTDGTATPAPPPEPVKAKTTPKVTHTTDHGTQPHVITIQAPPQSTQCVNVTAPSSVAAGSQAVFKVKLCSEDGSPAVTLNFRPVNGSWQSRLMPLALGSHTAKIAIDSTYAGGLEYYVTAGDASKGSAGSPLRVPGG